jgi:NADH:ubiquinone oxidoreductase subunit
MKSWFLQLFTWWNGQTLGTRFFTWRKGERVGEDRFGNIYYRTRGGAIDPALGVERRWVIYAGEADASMIPPGWHGWLHGRTDLPPPEAPYTPREWELPHQGNMTGTPLAWRPKGSTLGEAERQKPIGDYEAWRP